jgi:hypothetical protein
MSAPYLLTTIGITKPSTMDEVLPAACVIRQQLFLPPCIKLRKEFGVDPAAINAIRHLLSHIQNSTFTTANLSSRIIMDFGSRITNKSHNPRLVQSEVRH